MNFKVRKKRHKILYKNFVLLKKNVQNRRKLNRLKFKRRKWKNLITHLNRLQFRRKKKFIAYDINRYFLSKIFNSFKYKYNYILQTKKKFKFFYGGMTENYLKKQVKFVLKKKNSLKYFINHNSFFLNRIETRLDIVLYRAHFALSVRSAKQLILHKHVKVNKKLVTNYSYFLSKNDLIEISKNFKLVKSNVQNSNIWPLPPKYLNINYKNLQIVFANNNFDYQNYSTYFPFQLDLHTIIKLYK